MAQTTIASASKVILDLTDSGRLFVTITANHLRTQVKAKDSNGNPTLTPDWSKTNLVLTPVVYFDQQNIPIVNSKLSIRPTVRRPSLTLERAKRSAARC